MPNSLDIPDGSVAVRVSILDSTRMRLSCSDLLEPNIPQHQNLHVPSFSFLIEHPGLGQKILFDLGLRKNFASHPPAVQQFLDESHWELHVEKDITEILKESQVFPQDINAIIFSHHHFDHIGDMNQFPSPSEVVVGPGFQNAYLPAWPVKPESSLIDEDWQRRQVREITFENGKEILLIGGFRAFDYFGDGSLFLLDAPGHTVGHLAALARITLGSDPSKGYPRDQFVLLGGDICHYPGVFRPTTKSPLNSEAQSLTYVCPSSFFLNIHPETTRDRPYYKMPNHCTVDAESAKDSIQSLCNFDADEDVLVIISHDASLIGKIATFPESINGWNREVKSAWQWEFLADFCNKEIQC